MHSPLALFGLNDLEMEKSQLIGKANSIRTDLCHDASTLQPWVANVGLVFGIAREFKSADMAIPALSGLGVGGIAAIAVPKLSELAPALRWARVLIEVARVSGKFGKND